MALDDGRFLVAAERHAQLLGHDGATASPTASPPGDADAASR